jgi:Tfp pilus assembly protein PilP
MKPAITKTTTILVCVLAVGLASAQSPSIIQNARNTMNTVSNHAAAASNEALGVQQSAPAENIAHAPVKSSGVAVVVPAKSSSSHPTERAGAKRPGFARRRPTGASRLARPNIAVAVPVAEPKLHESVVAASGASETASETNEQSVVPDSKYNANGRRDPFISPVVSHAGGSGCSTGKKCLEIGAINLRGVVHSESGFIAVVSNGLNKAYFLRENDPVFNGYVMKITGDSIVFHETLQDRLGKTVTREVVKKITTPAV